MTEENGSFRCVLSLKINPLSGVQERFKCLVLGHLHLIFGKSDKAYCCAVEYFYFSTSCLLERSRAGTDKVLKGKNKPFYPPENMYFVFLCLFKCLNASEI